MTQLQPPDVATSSRRRSRRAPKRLPRADIQGLRALAVLAVIADHLYAYPRGGFVGVDIFFVLSGFLITGLLLRENEKTGSISFTGFYRRRAKRILPAALLVLVATVIAARLIFNSVRAGAIQTDGVWAALFAANWRFLTESTDYFNVGGPVSPLQHYWSLSIEEQFYFVWPWLMLGIFAALARLSKRTSRVAVGLAMAAIVGASFAWAMVESESDPANAYFDTFARVWELGVGALLAVAAPLFLRWPTALRAALGWAGLVAAIASLWVVDPDVGFPAPWAALPVLATALVIAAGTMPEGGQHRAMYPLTSKTAGYIGDISYSLYLWHFPIIVLGIALIGDSTADKVILLAVIASASIFSFHLVEDPIRRSALFERRSSRQPIFPVEVTRHYRYWSLGLVAAVVFTMAATLIFRTPEPPNEVVLTSPSASEEPDPSTPSLPEQEALAAEITTAVQLREWPKTSPTFEQVLADPEAPDDLYACGSGTTLDLASCSWGAEDPKHTAVIAGDSMSVMYATTLRPLFESLPGWRVYLVGAFGCAFSDVDTHAEEQPPAGDYCPTRREAAQAAIAELNPDLLLVSNTVFPYYVSGEDQRMTEAQWREHLGGAIEQASDHVGQTVILAPPPVEKNPADCYSPGSTPADCVGRVGDSWNLRAVTERAVATDTGSIWVDSEPWFCVRGYCPMTVGNHVVKFDPTHITPEYGEDIAPAVREALEQAGVLRAQGRVR